MEAGTNLSDNNGSPVGGATVYVVAESDYDIFEHSLVGVYSTLEKAKSVADDCYAKMVEEGLSDEYPVVYRCAIDNHMGKFGAYTAGRPGW